MFDLIFLEFSWTQLLQPQWYIDNGGLWLMLLIIFAETGLFIGFFFPGDSLLFVAGIFSNKLAASLYDTQNDFLNLLLIAVLCIIAGVLGNTVGYLFGRKVGPAMYSWKDRFLFKQKYLQKFSFFNIIGCIAWVTSMLFLGHYLNSFVKKQFGIDLEKHLEIIVIAIVLVTTAPILFKLFFGKKKRPENATPKN